MVSLSLFVSFRNEDITKHGMFCSVDVLTFGRSRCVGRFQRWAKGPIDRSSDTDSIFRLYRTIKSVDAKFRFLNRPIVSVRFEFRFFNRPILFLGLKFRFLNRPIVSVRFEFRFFNRPILFLCFKFRFLYRAYQYQPKQRHSRCMLSQIFDQITI